MKLAACEPGAHAAFNLVCRSFHSALPDAFTSPEPEASATDFPGPSQAFGSDARRCAGGTWPHASTPDGPISPCLHFSLDCLGAMAPASTLTSDAFCAALHATGRRFAAVGTVRLTARQASCVVGAALFTQHVAPHLTRVRHLFISAAPACRLPPFWMEPGFASLAAHLRELSMHGPYSLHVPLAAQLADAFPALTSLHQAIFTPPHLKHGPGPPGLTILAPATLRALLLSVQEVESETSTFTLTLAGTPSHLTHLMINTCPVNLTHYGDFCRPVAVAGHLAALHHLDITIHPTANAAIFTAAIVSSAATVTAAASAASVDSQLGDPQRTPLFHASTRPPCFARVHLVCPALSRLVLRSAADALAQDDPGPAHAQREQDMWAGVVRSLAPLAGTLKEVELLLAGPLPGYVLGSRAEVGGPMYLPNMRAALWAAMAEALPDARLCIAVTKQQVDVLMNAG